MTTNAGKTLNQENLVPIGAYITLHSLILWGLAFGVTWNEGFEAWLEKLFASGAWLLISGIVVTLLNGLMDSTFKAVLVFWRTPHPLPGCRAFSQFMTADPRIDSAVLEERYGCLPDEPVAQNQLWYKIYRKHRDNPVIADVHKKFLLTRDLTSISLLFFPVLSIAGFFLLENHQVSLIYTAILMLVWIISCQAAKTYGARFVCNVLAEESVASTEPSHNGQSAKE
jgi:ABC-type transport system involved in multi-copper enzyme maturation permease subunit